MDPSDALELAKEAGFTLPSPAWIFGCILFSLVGIGAWYYGKAVKAPRVRWLGLALMLYCYVTSPTWLLYGVGIALCVAIWWTARAATELPRPMYCRPVPRCAGWRPVD